MTIHSLKTTLSRVWHSVGASDRDPALRHPTETATPPISSSIYSGNLARAEGWGVFYSGNREDGSACYQLQALDDGIPSGAGFADDVNAWEHVVARAREGSSLHLAALGLIDPVELRLIRYWCSAEDLAL